MSSDLKDARWQLAEEYATEDGKDFYAMEFDWQNRYLTAARTRLGLAPNEVIEALAAKFRKEDK